MSDIPTAADRIASLRRVFTAQPRTPEGYALTQACVLLCDLLDTQQAMLEAQIETNDLLREFVVHGRRK